MLKTRFTPSFEKPGFSPPSTIRETNDTLTALMVVPNCSLDTDERKLVQLPVDAKFAELHVKFPALDHVRLKTLSSSARGVQVARILLQDWIVLAMSADNGALEDTTTLTGTSPLVQPKTLREFGAIVHSEALGATSTETVAYEHTDMTGRTQNRSCFQFFIDKPALVASIPTATTMLDRLR